MIERKQDPSYASLKEEREERIKEGEEKEEGRPMEPYPIGDKKGEDEKSLPPKLIKEDRNQFRGNNRGGGKRKGR